MGEELLGNLLSREEEVGGGWQNYVEVFYCGKAVQKKIQQKLL